MQYGGGQGFGLMLAFRWSSIGPSDQPQWGCNLWPMGTDERTEVTGECPSAGEQVADSNMREIKEPGEEKRGI